MAAIGTLQIVAMQNSTSNSIVSASLTQSDKEAIRICIVRNKSHSNACGVEFPTYGLFKRHLRDVHGMPISRAEHYCRIKNKE